MKRVIVSVPLPVSLVQPGDAGTPMLFTATDIRIQVIVEDQNTRGQKQWDETLQQAVDAVIRKHPEVHREGMGMRVAGAGLKTIGARAAALVGAIAGLLYAHRRIWNPLVVQEIAYSVVKDAYEEAPAVIAACVAGGVIWSRRELPFLASTWQLPMTIPQPLQKFSLAITSSRSNHEKQKIQRYSPIEYEQEVKLVAIALKAGDSKKLRSYYAGGVALPQFETELRFGAQLSARFRAITIGGDGIRLESQ